MSIFSKIYVQQACEEPEVLFEDDNVPVFDLLTKDEFNADDISVPDTFPLPWGMDDYTQESKWVKIAQLALAAVIIGGAIYVTIKDAQNIRKAAAHNKKVFEQWSNIRSEYSSAKFESYVSTDMFKDILSKHDEDAQTHKELWNIMSPFTGSLLPVVNQTAPDMLKVGFKLVDALNDVNVFVVNIKEDDESTKTLEQLEKYASEMTSMLDGLTTIDELYEKSKWVEKYRSIAIIKEIARNVRYQMSTMGEFTSKIGTNWMGWYSDSREFQALQDKFEVLKRRSEDSEKKLKELKVTSAVRERLSSLNANIRQVVRVFSQQIKFYDAAGAAIGYATASQMELAKQAANFKADMQSHNPAVELQHINRTHSNIATFPFDANASVGTFLSEHGGSLNTTDSLQNSVIGADGKTNSCMQADESISIVASEVERTGCVCREQVETIVKYHGPFLPPSVPVNSFTAEPTQQNVDVVKEALAFKRTPALMGAIASASRQLGSIVEHIRNTDHTAFVTEIEDMSFQANQVLGSVVEYEAIAPTMYLHMGDGLTKDDEAKRIARKLHPMALTVTTDELVRFKDAVNESIEQVAAAVAATKDVLDAINDKDLLRDVPVLIAGDAAKEKASVSPKGAAFQGLVKKLADALGAIDMTDANKLHETLKVEWAFYEQQLSYAKEAMRTNVGNSYEYTEHVMASLTNDFLVPRQLINTPEEDTFGELLGMLKTIEELHYKGKKPLFAVAGEITQLVTTVRKLCEYYVALHQMTSSALYFYCKLVVDKMRVASTLKKQEDGLIKTKDALALAGLIRSTIRKSSAELPE